jgi:uncharacterized membrane protein
MFFKWIKMKPLLVLLIAFIACIGITKILHNKIRFRQSAVLAMSAMFIFTATAHFIYTEGMIGMLPEFIPCRKQIVFATGLLEIQFAVGLVFRKTRRTAAWCAVVFLVLILPANIYAAMNEVDFTDPSTKGPGAAYLWFRIPLQIFFIAWIYFAAVINPQNKSTWYKANQR